MSRLIIPIIFYISINSLFAQEIDSKKNNREKGTLKNNLYVELLGKGIYYSINYEKPFTFRNYDLLFHIGAAYVPIDFYRRYVLLPISTYKLIGYNSTKLEIGIGATLAFNVNPTPKDSLKKHESDPSEYAVPYEPFFRILGCPSIGYRFYKSHFLFRTAFYLYTYNHLYDKKLVCQLWGGISFGVYILQ